MQKNARYPRRADFGTTDIYARRIFHRTRESRDASNWVPPTLDEEGGPLPAGGMGRLRHDLGAGCGRILLESHGSERVRGVFQRLQSHADWLRRRTKN